MNVAAGLGGAADTPGPWHVQKHTKLISRCLDRQSTLSKRAGTSRRRSSIAMQTRASPWTTTRPTRVFTPARRRRGRLDGGKRRRRDGRRCAPGTFPPAPLSPSMVRPGTGTGGSRPWTASPGNGDWLIGPTDSSEGSNLTDRVKESMNDPHAWSRTWEDGDEPPVLKEMLATGVIRRKWQEVLAEYQPQVLSLWNERRLKWKPCELDPKTREFITIALGMVSGSHHLANHFNSALEKGATVQELVDVCVVTGHLTGAQSWDIGLASLDSVIELRAKAGLPVPRDSSEL